MSNLNDIIQAIESSGAIDYTSRCARQEAEQAFKALDVLTESDYKDALVTLAHFSVERTF